MVQYIAHVVLTLTPLRLIASRLVPTALLVHQSTDPIFFPCDFYRVAMDGQLNAITSKLKSTIITHDRTTLALKYAWPALKLALIVFEKTLDGVPIPGLKGAIGGILELAKTTEVSIKATQWPATCSRTHNWLGIDPECGGCPRASEAHHEAYSHLQTLVRSTGAPPRAQISN